MTYPQDEALLLQCHLLLHHQTVAQQEAERKRIAAYLNDTAVQCLTALHMELSLLLSKPQTEETPQQQLAESLDLVAKLVEDMTMLARSLRPLELGTIGLDAALRQACEEFRSLTQIPVFFHGVELPSLPEAEALAFYRLTQQAFANILQHGQSAQVLVTLQRDEHTAILSIHDDGGSIASPAQLSDLLQTSNLQLFGLMRTIQHLNGTLTVKSADDQGTTITAVLPYASVNPVIA